MLLCGGCRQLSCSYLSAKALVDNLLSSIYQSSEQKLDLAGRGHLCYFYYAMTVSDCVRLLPRLGVFVYHEGAYFSVLVSAVWPFFFKITIIIYLHLKVGGC